MRSAVDGHGQLPIHCEDDHEVAREMLRLYSDGARVKDIFGQLPIHLHPICGFAFIGGLSQRVQSDVYGHLPIQYYSDPDVVSKLSAAMLEYPTTAGNFVSTTRPTVKRPHNFFYSIQMEPE